MTEDFTSLPIDRESADLVAAQGLRLGLVDTSDGEKFAKWMQVDARGFHGPMVSDGSLEEWRRGIADRRTTAVWDDAEPDPTVPVATTNSWPTDLSVPGERSIRSWAISSVTVAPTHRRKGIARALLEGELRTASALGVPMAMLTVSESTIYGRFGFAPAALSTSWKVNTKRAAWTGPATPGAVRFVSVQDARALAADIHERVRLESPGEIPVWAHRWDQNFGLAEGEEKDRWKKLRAVRYDDTDGVPQGVALYQVRGGEEDFTAHIAELLYLVSATDDAYSALWRYVLELDLVTEVQAWLRSVDEPFQWQIADFRAARANPQEHQYLRILDVAACLEGRGYAAPGRLGFEVADRLGFASGMWLLEVDADGKGAVTRAETFPDDVAVVSLSVNELSSIYLGGVRADTLARAGRITELRSGAAAAIDASFRSVRTPWLSIWY